MPGYPCPKCDKNCSKTQHSLQCNCCEQWLHKDCVEGMTDAYYENVQKSFDLFGSSAFLCKTCRKVVTKLTRGQKELEAKVKTLEREKEELAKRVEQLEKKTSQNEGGLKKVETGLEKAKEEVKEEVRLDMIEKEERRNNMVIYGLDERDKDVAKERAKDDEEKVKKIWEALDIDMEEEEVEVKFRAGKKRDDGKPRPLIIRFKEEEKKERALNEARKLARKEGWKKVFLSPDLTPKQREEDRKKEEERKKEAEEKNAKARDEGKQGKWIVVGQRGRRRVVWKEEDAD